MTMSSPISQLREVLESVRASAENYRSQLIGNEAATRAALIDPVLHALGWDISDPARVEVEKTHSAGLRFDYALLRDGQVAVIIEAKKLGGNLEEGKPQIFGYALALGIRDVFITNGISWHHYHGISSENTDPTEKLLLESGDLAKIASYFIANLDVDLISPEATIEEETQSRVDNLEQKIAKLEEELSKIGRLPHGHINSEKYIDLERRVAKLEGKPPPPPPDYEILRSEVDYTGRSLESMTLPDGQERSVSNWKFLLVEAARFALQNHLPLRNQIPFPDKARRATSLILAHKPGGSVSSAPVQVDGQEFWIYTNYSANAAVANVLYLQDLLPADLRSVPIGARFLNRPTN
jgi:hypothetical protein